MTTAGAAAVALAASSAFAQPVPNPANWVGGTGSWLNAGNWDTNPNVPTIANNNLAQIGVNGNSGTAQIVAGNVAEAAVLDIGQQAGQTGHLEISGGTLNLLEMRVGGRDLGLLGTNAGGTGTVVQSGGDININVNADPATTNGVQSLFIGDGNATTNTAVGIWNMTAGTLNVGLATNDTIVIGTGAGSTGTFTQQGGTVNSSGEMTVARRGATAKYNMQGGALNLVDDLKVGNGEDAASGASATSGTFLQSGGVVKLSGWTDAGPDGIAGNTDDVAHSGTAKVGYRGGTGSYTIGNNAQLLPTWDLYVGDGGDMLATSTGTFVQNGTSTVTADKTVVVGRNNGTGSYTINGGSLTAKTNLNVGSGGTGTFTQNAGTTVTSLRSGSIGFTVTVGTLTQTGSGVYNQNGGALAVGASGDVFAIGNGQGSTGTFNQSGTVTLGGLLQLGRTNGTGTYNLNAGTLTLNGNASGANAGALVVGGGSGQTNGTGTFNQQPGTTVTSAGDNNIGFGTSTGTGNTAVGTYNMFGGNLNLNKSAGVTVIGNGGAGAGAMANGTFNQHGGAVTSTVGNALIVLGRNSGSGTYNMTGGTVNTFDLTIGGTNSTPAAGQALATVLNGTGTWTQDGAVVAGVPTSTTTTVTNNINLGQTNNTTAGTASGTYNLRNGTLNMSGAAKLLVLANGLGASGYFNQSGGSVTAGDDTLDLGRNGGEKAVYSMSGGSLNIGTITMNSATSTPVRERTFTMTGGSLTAGTVNFGSIASNANRSLNINGNATANITTLTMGGTAGNSITNIGTSVPVTIGTATVGATSKLNITESAGANHVVRINTLDVTGGKVDLANNKLITASPIGTATGGTYSGVQGLVQSAYGDGSWNGTSGGLTTSMPQATNDGLTTIAVATGGQLGINTFAGQSVAPTDTIAFYTYGGDTNFDGMVSGDDYGTIDFSILVPGADGYYNGDFNYDGVINGDDYGIIDFTIIAQGAPFPTSGSVASASSSAGLSGVTAVPEPASVGLIGLAATALFFRRRRRAIN